MEYLTNLMAYKKYSKIKNTNDTFGKEEVDKIIAKIDGKIRHTILKGESSVLIYGDVNRVFVKDYTLTEVRTLFNYLDYHYHKQGFKTKIRKSNTITCSTIEIKLKKVKEKDLH